ncbi:MAG TPA: M48 family metallopeptidase [Pseudomonadales bacterium]
MSLPRRNPLLPEGINASQEHPLKEFAWLLAALLLLLALAIAGIGLAVRHLAPLLPFALEQRVLPANWLASDSSENHEQQQALQALADRLTAATPLPDGMRISVHYLDDDTANAFATLGGHVFVMQGLLDQLDSENALAMVLAHEIAHIRHRHPIQSLSQGIVLQLLLAAITGNSGAMQALAGSSGLMAMASFSRDMEREADAGALQMLQALYGHTRGAETFFTRLLEQQDDAEWAAFLQSHPGIRERLATIRNSQQDEGGLTPLPAALAPAL